MIRVAVLGVTGYAGGEAVRILAAHPAVQLTYLGAHSQVGTPLVHHHPQLSHMAWPHDGILEPVDPEQVAKVSDIAMLALPSRVSGRIAADLLDRGVRVIDLSGDLRLPAPLYRKWYGAEPVEPSVQAQAIYGLTEWARDQLSPETRVVSNPGCFATAVLMALLPLHKAGIIQDESLVVDAKSGISGAGRHPGLSGQFAELQENLWAYRIGQHQHVPEIERGLEMYGGRPLLVHLVTHVVPATRGILATCHARLAIPLDEALGKVQAAFWDSYREEPFVHVLPPGNVPQMKQVRGTNRVDIGFAVDPRLGRLVVVSVLDNLVKGAAGQAVQNLNRLIGSPEDTALCRLGQIA